MKKRILSIVLVLAMVFTLLPVSVSAASRRIPIYVGNLQVDYMAEVLLSEMDLRGKSDREKIQTVYDWIVNNCTRYEYEWDGTYYFNESEVYTLSNGQFAKDYQKNLSEGRIMLRQEYRSRYGLPNSGADYWDSDSNYYVTTCAYEMMLKRNGHCGNFSSLLAVLLGHLGYDSRLVYGDFVSKFGGEPVIHTWNYILLDGVYYWADVRIDHSNISNGYATGGHDYFMIESTEEWMVEHHWEPDYTDWLAASAAELQAELDAAASLVPEQDYRCSDWATGYMQTADAFGLISDSLLQTDLTQPITRAEFADVAVRLYETLIWMSVPAFEGESPFSDTQDASVLKAYRLGIVNGMGDGTFAPHATLTREQAATMLGRVYELAAFGMVGDGFYLPQSSNYFLDHFAISDYANYYVYFFVGQSIIDGMGDGTFSPKLSMTREQALKIAAVTAQTMY